jgi:hypothetical protein
VAADGQATPDIAPWISIAWTADGFDTIQVHARWRPREELEAFARDVADLALFNRSLGDLRTALRRAFPGAFDLEVIRQGAAGAHVVVRFHPPKGEPNPDPYG